MSAALIVLDNRTSRSIKRYTELLEQVVDGSRVFTFGGSSRFQSLWYKYITLPARLRRHKEQHILLPSEGYAYLLPFLGHKRTTVVIHDLHDIMNQEIPAWRICIAKRQLKWLVKADNLIAISEHTKADVTKLLGSSIGEKIQVIPNPLEDHWFNEASVMPTGGEFLQHSSYVLLIGTAAWYKNLDRAFNVLAMIPDVHIVRVGSLKQKWKDKVGQERITQFEGISDHELKWLYQHALCLFFPSIHEGFGWPVAEAMASGCPVVCSDRASLPEVAGDSAIYVNPYDSSNMQMALQTLINEKGKSQEMSINARKRANKFRFTIYEFSILTTLAL